MSDKDKGPSRPVREERHEVVIVGAGLGGSIAAFRLSEVGVRNVVLERGRRWPIDPAGTVFPPFPSLDKRLIWLDDESAPLPPLGSTPWEHLLAAMKTALPRSTGLLDIITEDHAVVVCGAGVGGSTLVYGGVLAQPRPEAFHQVFPAGPDFGLLERVHYPRARRRLGGMPFPTELLDKPPYQSHRLWDQAVQASGLPAETIWSSYDLDALRGELRGDRPAAAIVGQYHFTGCNSGAKVSADRTYLARAEATGRTSVRPLHKVTDLSTDRSGRYRIQTERLAADGTVIERVVFSCDRLLLAAGAHTPRLLLAARQTGGLPGLPSSVGDSWSANGDHITALKAAGLSAGTPQGGPSSRMVHDASGTVSVMHSPVPLPQGGSHLMCLGMSIPKRLGKWLCTSDGRIRLEWTAEYDAGTQPLVEELLRRVARYLPDTAGVPPTKSLPLVAHPVGGVRLGETTDPHGRLHGLPRLYCVDGALMPGSTGAVNPALTIAAIVEYCMDHIVGDFLN
ncbi:GMC oxidoreductase [Streptomyces longwoodensis]|uniref:GMC oxidoreductase n=1 Tax=Streptomyces longwoodensis TaxID=68231 RepID=UPI0033E7EBC5